jgi:hypothetical protein
VLTATVAAVSLAVSLAAGPAPAARVAAAPTAAYRAAVVLAKDQSVYVDPSQARVLSREQANRVRGKITRVGGAPIYVAVLPGNAATGAGIEQLKELTQLLNPTRKATIAVVTGGRLRAASTAVPYATAQRFAEEAIAANDGEPLDVTISDFISRVAREQGRSESGGTGGVITGVVMTVFVFGGGGILLLRRRHRWRELNRLQPLVQDDLAELELELLAVPEPEASSVREPLLRARRAFKNARGVEHLQQVAVELAATRRAVAVARATLAGEVPPPDRAPCFFDARHGASAVDVEWAPPGGAGVRSVPACTIDAERVRSGVAPGAREIEVGDDRLGPWFEGRPEFGYYLTVDRRTLLHGLPAGKPLRRSRWLP